MSSPAFGTLDLQAMDLLHDSAIRRDIKTHAIAGYPSETVGYIDRGGYVRLENLARARDGVERSGPRHEFDCGDQLSGALARGDVVALVHSHPDGPEGPSARDMAQQRALALPWGLLMSTADVASEPYFWGDQLTPPPLEGRPFRHGPSGTDGRGDCGALIRDWYRLEREVLLPDFARDDRWWHNGQALYLDNYLEAGFRQVSATAPRVGDVILMAVRAETANHAAIFHGDHLLLHHLENRLSRLEPVVNWRKHIRTWLRHESDPTPDTAA